MPPLRLTCYQDLKAKLLGPVGSPKRDQFERGLAPELAAMATVPKASCTPKPRENKG